jgi:hypothetical protein
VHPETGEIRNVTVPLGHEISGDTLRNIVNQCGADDFRVWCVARRASLILPSGFRRGARSRRMASNAAGKPVRPNRDTRFYSG